MAALGLGWLADRRSRRSSAAFRFCAVPRATTMHTSPWRWVRDITAVEIHVRRADAECRLDGPEATAIWSPSRSRSSCACFWPFIRVVHSAAQAVIKRSV